MSLTTSFNKHLSPDELVPGRKRPRKAAPPPFSLRLSAEERARLTAEAAGAPLGTYIKAKLLGGAPLRTRRSGLAIEDRQALARALALLGQSGLSTNLTALAQAASIGTLPLTPEIEAELAEALRAVADIRALILRALGRTAEASP